MCLCKLSLGLQPCVHKQWLGLGFCINRKVSLSTDVRMLAAVNVGNHYIGYCGYLCFTTSTLNSLIQDANSIEQIHSSVLFLLHI